MGGSIYPETSFTSDSEQTNGMNNALFKSPVLQDSGFSKSPMPHFSEPQYF